MVKNISLKHLQIVLAGILFIVLSLNFYIANNLKYDAYGDAAGFLGLGVSLAKVQKYGSLDFSETGGLIQAFKKNKIKGEEYKFIGHSTWRPPVWPFLIAGIFVIFGYNLTYLLIFKLLLHLIGILIFYKTLRLLKLRDLVVIIGVFLYGISPAWQLYSRVFLSEPITLFFITLWVYLLIRFINSKSTFWPQAIVAGILVLSHPYYIFLPFSVWLLLLLKKQFTFKLFFLSSIICASIISIWIIRNFVVLETSAIVLTTSSGAVMAKGWNEDVISEHTNTQGDLANEGLVLDNYNYNREKSYNEVERMQLYKNATLHFIRSNPEKILPIIGIKLKSAFNPFPEIDKSGILESGRWFFQFLALLSLLYIILYSRNKIILTFAFGLILSTIGITILTYSGFRFRMPQVGLELLFVTYMLNDLITRIGKNIKP